MKAADAATPSRRSWFARAPEAGLVVVILVLGLVLTIFGGSVKRPKMETGPDGQAQYAFTSGPDGERSPVFEEVNKFFNAQNLTQLAKDTSFTAIMAVGATMIIIAGGIDLSVGAIYALASVLGALVFHRFGPSGSGGESAAGVVLGIATCLGVAVACGVVNGAMVTLLKVHPFIITLGTMAIFRGIAFVITKAQSVGDLPAAFRELVLVKTANNLTLVPLGVMVLVTLAGGVYLSRMRAGRLAYAVGGNELASRYSGIRIHWVKLSVFVFSGLSAGIAGLLALGYYGSASSGDADGKELSVIAAAVVGGASLTGGKGSALGALLGALIIQMIDSGIVTLGIDQNYSRIITGAVVIVAVVLDQLNNWLARRRLTQAA
jgi:ribose transport system permease protein